MLILVFGIIKKPNDKISMLSKNYWSNTYLVFPFILISSPFVFSQNLEVPPHEMEQHNPETKVKPRQVDVTIGNSETVIRMTVEVIDGYVIAEGDIILGTEEEVFANNAAIFDIAAREWPNSTIPYTIQSGYPDEDMIKYAINHIINNTNICMIPRTSETNYVEFVTSGGCSSTIGMAGGKQNINVSVNCGIASTIHEILHAAGHWHEQSREDRDDYVTINFGNITSGREDNFDKYSEQYSGTDIGPYDYASLMHYSPDAFSSNGLPTIEIKMPPGDVSTNIGQRIKMSSGDIAAVNQVYTATPSCTPLTVPANLSCQDLGTLSINNGVVTISNIVIYNSGSSATSNTATLRYYYLRNNTFSYFGSTETIPVLNPGQTANFGTTVDLTFLPDDTYSIGFRINHNNAISEGNTSDNFCNWNAPLLILPVPSCETNLTIPAGTVSGTYEASSTIATSGAVIVSGTAIFEAPTSIQLNDGFHAQSGSTFTARVGAGQGCFHDPSNLETFRIAPNTLPVLDESLTNQAIFDLQINPNPFVHQTNIGFHLVESAELEIAIYDLNGQKLEQVSSQQNFAKGTHQIIHNTNNLKAGMYLTVVQGKDLNVTKKIVIIR